MELTGNYRCVFTGGRFPVNVCPHCARFSRRRPLSRAISCDGDLRSPWPDLQRPISRSCCTRTRTPIEIRDYREERRGSGETGEGTEFFSMTEHRPRLSSPFRPLTPSLHVCATRCLSLRHPAARLPTLQASRLEGATSSDCSPISSLFPASFPRYIDGH